MSRLSVPSTVLRDRILDRAPESKMINDLMVWDDLQQVPQGVDEIEFWVPPFLHSGDGVAGLEFSVMPNLKVIQTQSAGVDAILSLVPAGVQLCDARGVHGSSTSEWVLTAILSVLREFPRFERARIEHRWDYAVTDELAGKRVLVIGAGDVGEHLGRRLVACDASPIFVARTARQGVHGVDELPALLPQADVVVLIVPKTRQTTEMVDKQFLSLMRDGALLVNAARGSVVNTAALLAELQSGRLRAALDVTDREPLPSDDPLWNAPNLLLTPHVGGSVFGLTDRFVQLLIDQVRKFEAGEPLQNIVSGEY